MKKYICNPVNLNYRYQFYVDPEKKASEAVAREAADPSVILFQGRYYMFASMTLGVWISEDLAQWEYHRLPDMLPLYDYAPDVRVRGEYVYFSASKRGEICNFYRTKDIMNGPYEELKGCFDFWDPNLFIDEDGRIYFYWGCNSITPIYGVELDVETMRPLTKPRELIWGDPYIKGYERLGEDGTVLPREKEELDALVKDFFSKKGGRPEDFPMEQQMRVRGFLGNTPFIEGAWMDKYKGRYYLQYAFGGTEYNTYGDGVYVSDKPLGPFCPAENNPYSYKPGGFLPGAGHGSTFRSLSGGWWHAATMRISMNHSFERRVGIWPAGFDKDGELFCNQRYGDWPIDVTEIEKDPWKAPEWYLLSYGKCVSASSSQEAHGPKLACDENVRTWWRAADTSPGQWIEVDLGECCDVRAIQINFADDFTEGLPELPGEIYYGTGRPRHIEERIHVTRWHLQGSLDGKSYFTVEDKTQADTDLAHDLVIREDGFWVRYIRLNVEELPFGQPAAVSGLRIFGIGSGDRPPKPVFEAKRTKDTDIQVTVMDSQAVGWNILWGTVADKLYHSYMVFSRSKKITGLVKGKDYYMRVDAFNEAGITEGTVIRL